MVNISPGYDDRGLHEPGRLAKPYREVGRDRGATYRRGTAFVEGLENPPDLVLVSSFNNFHENTHIEPTVGVGDAYVALTRECIDRIRNVARSSG
jgi:hypothetical protein